MKAYLTYIVSCISPFLSPRPTELRAKYQVYLAAIKTATLPIGCDYQKHVLLALPFGFCAFFVEQLLVIPSYPTARIGLHS